MGQLAGRRHRPGRDPALRLELGCVRAPHGGVKLHGQEGDVEDLAFLNLEFFEHSAVFGSDGLREGDDVVAEDDALGLRGRWVDAETRVICLLGLKKEEKGEYN